MRERLRGALAPTIAFAAVLALWQASVWMLRPPRCILPAVDRVVAGLIAFGRGWVADVVATSEGIVVGFVAAVVLRSLRAVLIVASDTIRRAITPLLVTIQIVPKIAFAPLILVWF